MDHIRIYVITTLFLVLLGIVGSAPSGSTKCTNSALRGCKNIPGLLSCRLFRKRIKCLEKIDYDCANNQVMMQIAIVLRHAREQAEICPGLPPNSCFYDAWKRCVHHMPVPRLVTAVTKGSEDQKKENCDEFSRKLKDLKECATELKPKCDSANIKALIDRYLQFVDANKNFCPASNLED